MTRQLQLSQRVLDGVAGLEGVHAVRRSVAGGRLPHIVCLGIDGIEPQAVLLGLDQAGIAVHSGSACASEDLQPSPVLEAMGVDAHRSLRVSVGWDTTDADVDAFLTALPAVHRPAPAAQPVTRTWTSVTARSNVVALVMVAKRPD